MGVVRRWCSRLTKSRLCRPEAWFIGNQQEAEAINKLCVTHPSSIEHLFLIVSRREAVKIKSYARFFANLLLVRLRTDPEFDVQGRALNWEQFSSESQTLFHSFCLPRLMYIDLTFSKWNLQVIKGSLCVGKCVGASHLLQLQIPRTQIRKALIENASKLSSASWDFRKSFLLDALRLTSASKSHSHTLFPSCRQR